jgi:WD40 repeat protein
LFADTEGVVRAYDIDGGLMQEVSGVGEEAPWLTGVVDSRRLQLDAGGRRLLMSASSDDGLYVLDLETGTVDAVALGIANHAIKEDGRLLAVVSFDGTVRLWDVERRAWAGLVWDGTGELGRGGPGWYDAGSDSLWIASSGQLLQIPVDPERWIERACEIVGRDFTDDEWDLYVPGDEERQSACS